MTIAHYEKKIDQLLRPIGFRRKGRIWNRKIESYIDVVSIQKSKSSDLITINIGVCEVDVYSACWLDKVPDFIDESVCAFRARIGELVGDKDIWWNVNDDEAPSEATETIKNFGLDVLENFHSNENLIAHLQNVVAEKPYYPLPFIYLSLLLMIAGRQTEGEQLLLKCKNKTTPAWKERINRIIEKY